MLAGTPQDRMRTNNQDVTQVAIALFGDRPKLLFAASRILPRYKSNLGRPVIRNDRQQRLNPLPPLRRHNTEFGHMRPQRIDHLGPLAHQQIAGSMLHQLTLLLGRLDAYEAHGWASDRLADRLGISGIIFVTLDISLYILRWHQAHLMAKLRQFACPVVRRSTGFHADQARRQSLEEPHHLTAAELLPDDDLLRRINAVNLEHVLGEIQTNRGDLHVDGSLM